MTLPGAILFPQSLMPLFIFENKYRKMMRDMINGERLLCIALARNHPEQDEDAPLVPHTIAGMGIMRACVRHPDGTGHMVIQGLARVALSDISEEKPYRTARVRPLPSSNTHGVEVEALMMKVVEMAVEKASRLKCAPCDLPQFLQAIRDPDIVSDVIGYTLIRDPQQKQRLLETSDVRQRLHDLIPMLK
jgi:Lon protease-like protein